MGQVLESIAFSHTGTSKFFGVLALTSGHQLVNPLLVVIQGLYFPVFIFDYVRESSVLVAQVA